MRWPEDQVYIHIIGIDERYNGIETHYNHDLCWELGFIDEVIATHITETMGLFPYHHERIKQILLGLRPTREEKRHEILIAFTYLSRIYREMLFAVACNAQEESIAYFFWDGRAQRQDRNQPERPEPMDGHWLTTTARINLPNDTPSKEVKE